MAAGIGSARRRSPQADGFAYLTQGETYAKFAKLNL